MAKLQRPRARNEQESKLNDAVGIRLPSEQRQCHCFTPSIAPHFCETGVVMGMASGETAYPITACAMGMGSDGKRYHDHRPIAQGKIMAERHETQQEKEARWTAQRAAHEAQDQASRATRARTRGRHWLVGGAIVLIIVVMAVVILL